MRDRVLSGAQISPGDHVIDLSVGNGLLTLGALSLVGVGGTVTAIDRSHQALETIPPAGFGAGTLRRVLTEIADVPLQEDTADAVVARAAFAHAPDLIRAFREVARVVRPGGRLSLFEPVYAERRHDANLRLTPAEIHAAEEALQWATPGARYMHRLDMRTATRHVRRGFRDIEATMDTVVVRLEGRNDVHAYLHRPPHPSVPSTVDTIAAHDRELAARYATAWHQAIDTQAKITITTPGFYLTATRADTPIA
ncbi:class I SAM-dependent methyltransferase [Frankia sp. BMG5.23]|uniref:class I SAM-dependent methyltransferase n=2 Tax=unclassified Frankia TaxID=2632575 RepID=UPI001F19D80A|nr:methyltransferase domain-containing protein [Frankia sp. BMG5.23]